MPELFVFESAVTSAGKELEDLVSLASVNGETGCLEIRVFGPGDQVRRFEKWLEGKPIPRDAVTIIDRANCPIRAQG